MNTAHILAVASGTALVAASAASSIRHLRWLALAAGALALAALLAAGGNHVLVTLAALATAANAWQLAALSRGGRRGGMRAEERALLEHILRVDDAAGQRRLIGLLDWRDTVKGQVIIRQGQPNPPLIYVASGSAAIELDGRRVGEVGAEDFLGDMSIATGEPASTQVIVTEPMRLAVIDRAALAQLAAAAPEIGAAFDRALNRSLATKIARMNRIVAGE